MAGHLGVGGAQERDCLGDEGAVQDGGGVAGVAGEVVYGEGRLLADVEVLPHQRRQERGPRPVSHHRIPAATRAMGRPPSLSSAEVPALMPQVSSNDLIRRVLRCLLSHRRRQGDHCPLSSVPRLHVSIAAAWSRQADTATNWAAASPPWYTTARPNSTPPAVLTRPCVIRQQLSTSDTTQRIRHRARTLPDCFTSHRIAQPEGWPGASL